MKIVKVIKYTYICVALVIIVGLLTVLLESTFSKKKYFDAFGYSFFEVQSYSMYPELTKGDLVIVKKRDSSEYEVGMTVTYLRPADNTTTTHKIVSIDGNLVTTKGINENTNKDYDLPFDIENVVGEVVCVWTEYDEVRNFITHPVGIIIIILTGLLFIEGLSFLEDKFSTEETSRKD